MSMELLTSASFWVAVGQIILIDILLGGDNAVVIALACRKLPPAQRKQGILWGTAGAVVLRIVLIFFALQLLAIPLLKLVGALLLVWIGVKLLLPEDDDAHGNLEASDRLWGAVKTVIVADFVMSVDNVIAIAGAAESSGGDHSMALVIFGVLVSIPIIVWGSQLVIKLMDRWPIIITLGGMLLGWIAGTMAVTDPGLVNPDVLPQLPKFEASKTLHYIAGVAGALLVLAIGKLLASRRAVPATVPVPMSVPATAVGASLDGLRAVLVPVDGSAVSVRALQQALRMQRALGAASQALKVHLLHVQRRVSGDVSSFVTKQSLDDYYAEQADAALAPALAALAGGGGNVEEHRRIGNPGQEIADAARQLMENKWL